MSSSEEAQLGKRSKPASQIVYDDKTNQKLKISDTESEDKFEGEDEELDGQEGEEEFLFDEEEEGIYEEDEEEEFEEGDEEFKQDGDLGDDDGSYEEG
jgi:hypothetical protein